MKAEERRKIARQHAWANEHVAIHKSECRRFDFEKDPLEECVMVPIDDLIETAVMYGLAYMEKNISKIVQQYADKGQTNYQESYVNDGKCSSSTCYWDGFSDCAKAIKREIDTDLNLEP